VLWYRWRNNEGRVSSERDGCGAHGVSDRPPRVEDARPETRESILQSVQARLLTGPTNNGDVIVPTLGSDRQRHSAAWPAMNSPESQREPSTARRSTEWAHPL